MSNSTQPAPDERRCANCDSVLPAGRDICLMCGARRDVLAAGAESAGAEIPSGTSGEVPPAEADDVALPAEADEVLPAEADEVLPAEADEVLPAEADEALPAEAVGLAGTAGPAVTGEDVGPDATAEAEPEPIAERSRITLGSAPYRQPAGGAEAEPAVVGGGEPGAGGRFPALHLLTALVILVTGVVGYWVVRYGGPVELALVPTPTPLEPTATFTPSVTLPPSQTAGPTLTPSTTPSPQPSATPRPARAHAVAAGETLFGLALFYNVSMESIAALNGFDIENPIQEGQTLQVPWPTATPPLAPIAMEINGEMVIADPAFCERYTIEEGDAISVIAARNNMNMELLQAVNRLTEHSVLQPGDTICIPEVSYGGVLPPTPGPSPTPSATGFPAGPALLYPPEGSMIEMADEPIVLQWVAVKDLEPDEYYMVEMVDRTALNAHPQRAFTRETSFRVPGRWRPHDEALHTFEWHVSIVRVTGQREDGGFIYGYGGQPGEAATFTWRGAIPTATPTPTPTSSATPRP